MKAMIGDIVVIESAITFFHLKEIDYLLRFGADVGTR